ncbi:MAG TPA: hypothetical protein VFT10_06715 [Solirubrobacterales bacterium]|nr:hypothetical protein [Solirubrobacterales bacterium]
MVVLIAFAALAWQQDGGGDSPLNAIAAAAERTQREPGGRTMMTAIATSPVPSKSLTITGRGVYSNETDRSRMVLTFPQPGSDGLMEMEAVTDGTAMYMRSSMFGSLPGGAEWMMLDLSLGGDMEAPVPAGGDAAGELELLETATGGVQKLGKEDVRGVPTTRYRGTVEASERAEELREEGQDDLAAGIEKDMKPLTIEAWIDADGLVRRMRIVQAKAQAGGQESTVDMRLDFFDVGPVPEIEVPEQSEAFDATDLARAGLDQPSDD